MLTSWACAGSVNCGVFSDADRSNIGVAPGSIILIHSGGRVGPDLPQTAVGFPLTASLGGTTVRVTVGERTVDAYILATEAEWVRVLLPSNTPLGYGKASITYNGETTGSEIVVVVRRFGIYSGEYTAPNYLGPFVSTPRSIENLTGDDRVPNSPLNPARPGQLVLLRGTGLGPASGDEWAGPIPGDLSIPGLEVFAGNISARVTYAGRSSCCAGIDEVIFEVPPGIEGCNVPVSVRLAGNDNGSNDAWVAIGSGDGACSDPHGLSEPEVKALAAGTLKAAQIAGFNRVSTSGAQGFGDWSLGFGKADSTSAIPFGTCSSGGTARSPFEFDIVPFEDSGAAVNIRTPSGDLLAEKQRDNRYWVNFSGELEPGSYTAVVSGGRDVARLNFSFTVPSQTFTWNTPDSLSVVDDFTISWSGADPAGYVQIAAWFESGGEASGSGFHCIEKPGTGSFTIPSRILQRAAAAILARPLDPAGSYLVLWVGNQISKRITAPEFDAAVLKVLTLPLDRSDYRQVLLK